MNEQDFQPALIISWLSAEQESDIAHQRELLQHLFDRFDGDSDGLIDANELKTCFCAFGLQDKIPSCGDLLRKFSSSDNGKLDLDEWLQLMLSMREYFVGAEVFSFSNIILI